MARGECRNDIVLYLDTEKSFHKLTAHGGTLLDRRDRIDGISIYPDNPWPRPELQA
jgi:hypothetical protein